MTEEELRQDALERGTGRLIRASRPRPGEEPMRKAYLELLKLALTDLAAAHPLTVSRTGDTRDTELRIFCRELEEEQLPLRAMGTDWPFGGLTMVGLERLDDLQRCVESVVADGVEGDFVEAGAWRGGASILARATLDSLGADERKVVIADSFQGLPAPDANAFPEDRDLDLSRIDYLAVSLDEVRSHFRRFGLLEGIEFVQGFFHETLPTLRGRRWSVIRLDGDTYEATWIGLESLYPWLSKGGYAIIDDYLLIKECRAAVDDFREQHAITSPIVEVDWNGAHWRREDEPELAAPDAVPPSRQVTTPSAERVGSKPRRTPIPTERELELEREVAHLRRQLKQTAEASS